jgi:hypothetical protein
MVRGYDDGARMSLAMGTRSAENKKPEIQEKRERDFYLISRLND